MIFKLRVTLQDGKSYSGLGWFNNLAEAQDQTWADYPEAASISAICLRGGAAS